MIELQQEACLECMRLQVTYHTQRMLCVERIVTRKTGMRFTTFVHVLCVVRWMLHTALQQNAASPYSGGCPAQLLRSDFKVITSSNYEVYNDRFD